MHINGMHAKMFLHLFSVAVSVAGDHSGAVEVESVEVACDRECAVAIRDGQTEDEGIAMIQVEARTVSSRGSSSRTCTETYSPGMHLIQLADLQRQFLLFVPNETVQDPGGTPLVVGYHGHSDSPWYLNQAVGLSILLERYGWLGMFPFALNENATNGLGGILACCPPDCDEDCCRNGRHLNVKDGTACGWNTMGNIESDLVLADAMVDWAREHTCTDTSKVFATGFSSGGFESNLVGCHRANLFRHNSQKIVEFCQKSIEPIL